MRPAGFEPAAYRFFFVGIIGGPYYQLDLQLDKFMSALQEFLPTKGETNSEKK
jgi:hypothetical protein